jgi:hypothetical protein
VLEAGRLQILIRMRSLHSFRLPIPSSCTVALGLTQALTENQGGKLKLACKFDGLTTICEPIV